MSKRPSTRLLVATVRSDASIGNSAIKIACSIRWIQNRRLAPRIQAEHGVTCVKTPEAAKPLKGFGGAGVLEIVDNFDGNTYRTVYTARLTAAVYVLCAFQKESTRGVATPKRVLALIRSRLHQAELIDTEQREGG